MGVVGFASNCVLRLLTASMEACSFRLSTARSSPRTDDVAESLLVPLPATPRELGVRDASQGFRAGCMWLCICYDVGGERGIHSPSPARRGIHAVLAWTILFCTVRDGIYHCNALYHSLWIPGTFIPTPRTPGVVGRGSHGRFIAEHNVGKIYRLYNILYYRLASIYIYSLSIYIESIYTYTGNMDTFLW